MIQAICNMHALEMRARAVKWKWRESANAINENSHVTPYVLHFPDATWDRFPRSRVHGTCRVSSDTCCDVSRRQRDSSGPLHFRSCYNFAHCYDLKRCLYHTKYVLKRIIADFYCQV